MTRKIRARLDLVIVVAFGGLAFAVSAWLGLLERFYTFSRAHDNWELDEILVTGAALVFALGVFGFRRLAEARRLAAELSEANTELKSTLSEVKELRGILPICSHCKHVRTDDGYWQQVESYIATHTSATFSHSICPDCTAKLYPDIVDEIYPAGKPTPAVRGRDVASGDLDDMAPEPPRSPKRPE